MLIKDTNLKKLRRIEMFLKREIFRKMILYGIGFNTSRLTSYEKSGNL